MEHSPGDTLAAQLGRLRPAGDTKRQRGEREHFDQKFDRTLALPLARIEPALQWAVNLIASRGLKLDWVQLTDDLSFWERESKRSKWADEFLKSSKEERHAN
jgi:hypothetical protein